MAHEKRTMRLLQNYTGSALLGVIIFTLILSLLTAGFLTLGEFEAGSVQGRIEDTAAFYYAEGGAAYGLANVRYLLGSYLSDRLYSCDPQQVKADMEAYHNTGTTEGVVYFLQDYMGDKFDSFHTEGGPPIDAFIGTLNIPLPVLADNCDPVVTTFEATGPIEKDADDGDVYIVPLSCTIEAPGRSGDYTRTVTLTFSSLDIEVKRGSFARYAQFMEMHGGDGIEVWFDPSVRFMGPVHTNQYFNFEGNPAGCFYKPKPRLSYLGENFSGRVTQCEQEAHFWNNGSPIFLDTSKNKDIDIPTFYDGFYRNHPPVGLPDPTQGVERHIRAALGLGPSDTIPSLNSGVYVPINNPTEKVVVGGIYIKGDSTISLGRHADKAIYIITTRQPNIIMVDYSANTTEVHLKEPEIIDEILSGVPNGMIYSDDEILGILGEVQKNSQVTVAARQKIVIINRILYQQHSDFDYYPDFKGQPNAEGFDNMLGLISWEEDVMVVQGAPNNIEIHAVVMAPQGDFKVLNHDSGPPRGTATLLGGSITKYYHPFGTFDAQGELLHGYRRNFIYDIRVQLGMAPPFFPRVKNFSSTTKDGINNVSIYSAKPVWQST